MFWANQTNKLAGVTLLLLPVMSLIGFLGGAPMGELDPFDRASVEQLLQVINNNRGLFTLSMVPFVITDTVVMVAASALLYLTFRDRSHTLALIGAFGIFAAAITFVVHEVVAMTLPFLASDFFSSDGLTGIEAGDPSILHSARTISVIQGLTALCGQTSMGLGLTSFGILLYRSPEGTVNPPRWLGIAGIIGGLGSVSTWLFLINHTAGGIATIAGELATLLMLTVLGVWLLKQK